MDRLTCGAEFKFSKAGTDAMTFEGHGAVFNNIDLGGDLVEQGAFANTLAEAKRSGDWPALLAQHGALMMTTEDLTPIGVLTHLAEDSKGLAFAGKLAPTPRGTEYHTLMTMEPPAIKAMSMGYRAVRFTMGTKAGEPRRRIHEVKLFELSPVTFPMNTRALITSVKADAPTIREAEHALREAGFSRADAKAILAGVIELPSQRDAGADNPTLDGLKSLLAAIPRKR